MEFDYRLTGAGWARATLRGGSAQVEITASYLGDALGELLEAIIAILSGGSAIRCSWWEEPGEYRWIFNREGRNVRLIVLLLADDFPLLPDESGVEVFRTTEPLDDFATDIADAAQRVLDEYGEAGYYRHWNRYPFPTDSLRTIRRLLAAADA